MREGFIIQDTETNVVINQTEVEIMNAVVASGQDLDDGNLSQVSDALVGLMDKNEKMYHDNEIVRL